MAFLDKPDFCSTEKYRRHEADRIYVADFQLETIYTFMLLLADDRAGSSPFMFAEITTDDKGSATTVMNFASEDLTFEEQNIVTDQRFEATGIWLPPSDYSIIFTGAMAVAGYVRDYDDGIEAFWKTMDTELAMK